MADYKTKYETLLNAVNEIGSDPLKEIATVIERTVDDEPKEPTEQKPSVTREEFNKMGYTERVKLKQKHPDTYKALNGGI